MGLTSSEADQVGSRVGSVHQVEARATLACLCIWLIEPVGENMEQVGHRSGAVNHREPEWCI